MAYLQEIPFGAQYYRAPTPSREHWAADLAAMKENGFNTIKIWAQWRWNHPAPDEFDFSDLDELMDLAAQTGLKVIVNVILDVAPVWFCRDYPEAAMVMSSGRVLEYRTVECRQIGGAPGPCYNHPEAIRYKKAFVRALAARFARHPALLLWDLWNEPELTCSIARAADADTMVCYCPHCRAAFLRWLEARYGDIAALDRAWGRNYRSFDEVELPRSPRVFQDMLDWREFFADTLAADLRDRAEAVRQVDAVHPIMVHTVPPPYFNMINACCDDYKMARACDMFGNSIGSEPLPACLSVSSAPGKEVINAEIHAMGGTTFSHPTDLSYEQMKRHIFVPFSFGIKGFLFWQYRPESLGFESPAWGMIRRDGAPTPCLTHARRIHAILARDGEHMLRAQVQPAEIAVIRDADAEVFCWCADQSTDKAFQSLSGVFHALYNANFRVDILTATQLTEQDLSRYKMIVYPFSYYLRRSVADTLRAWVEQGGVLVAEAMFGSYESDGRHAVVTPGYGLERVFGAREDAVCTAAQFNNAYGEFVSREAGDGDLVDVQAQIAGVPLSFRGYYFRQSYRPAGAQPLGFYRDGSVALTHASYGKGQAVLLGSLVGCAYHRRQDAAAEQLFAALAGLAGVTRRVETSHRAVRASLLTDGGWGLLILDGRDEAGDVCVTVDGAFSQAVDADTGAAADLTAQGGKSVLRTRISAGEIRVFTLT